MTRLRRILAFGLAVALAALLAWVMLPSSAFAQASDQNGRCLACHQRTDLGSTVVEGRATTLTIDTDAWGHSMHSRLDCTSCHLGFKAATHTPAETQGWLQTAKLDACANCHAREFTMYRGSFHGKLVMRAGSGAPACADCHGSHAILNVTTAQFRRSILDMCGRCHGGRSSTYLDMYHGKAFKLGDTKAAVCTDCHGAHKILPACDPASLVSKQNIGGTCAGCHPGANANFATYEVHIDPSSPRSSFVVWLFYATYVLLISVVFTFGAVHSVLYFYRGRKEGMYHRGRH